MVRAIIFDCFGVLTTDLWKEFVATLPEAERQPARDLNHALDRGHLSKEDFMQEMVKLTGSQPTEVEQLLEGEYDKNTRLLDYIAELKKDYKIGLLSNISSDWVTAQFLNPEEQRLFDALVFSFQVGSTKPDALMFETVAHKLGVPLKECVMVDDVDSYCAAAEALGTSSVVYRNFAQFKRELELLLHT